ncbi:hypothetical protein ORS3428_30140 [Mesorhizobium sp. ORS 3428]|nr:hypothetical protein ORS3428_30140 [Mesorhizobium sp. ORS 3428]CDX35853.1 hypothetical protein MPLSOD_260004 [Mesorhizobium sp. SOD10]
MDGAWHATLFGLTDRQTGPCQARPLRDKAVVNVTAGIVQLIFLLAIEALAISCFCCAYPQVRMLTGLGKPTLQPI